MKNKKFCLAALLLIFIISRMYGITDSVSVAENLPGSFQPSATNITVWIFMSWFFFLILISIPFYFNHKRYKERQLVISNLIEKGHEIPKELLSRQPALKRSDLHKGIILISFGISVIIVLWSLKITNNYWTIGLIPLLIGIAYIVSFKSEKARK